MSRAGQGAAAALALSVSVALVGVQWGLSSLWESAFDAPWRVALLSVERVGGAQAWQEPWRWVTSTLVHAGASHAIANSALFALLFTRLASRADTTRSRLAVLGALLWVGWCTNGALSALEPQAHAVGFSGVVGAGVGALLAVSVRAREERLYAVASAALFAAASLAASVDHAAHVLSVALGGALFARSLPARSAWSVCALAALVVSVAAALWAIVPCGASDEAWHACFVAPYVVE